MSPSAVDVDVKGVTDTTALVAPDPTTINALAAWRIKGAVPTGTAALSNSDMFKSPACFTKPKAKRWDHIISNEAKARKPSTLKGAAEYLKRPGMISLGGGLPSSENFPFEEISMKIPSPPGFSEEETRVSGRTVTAHKHDIREGRSLFDLEVALNYGQATGFAQLLRFVTEHTEIVHTPPYADWQCCLTVGSTYSWDSALRVLCERGDYILTEEYSFASALETAQPLGIRAAAVGMDEQGLRADALDEVLTNWDSKARGARKPHLLYTVPSGQNPTGATQSAHRRAEVYKVCQKHDVYIVEDEPYYFLQMQPYKAGVPPPSSRDEFLKILLPSFLKLDVDGRVLRLDSFSKVLAPGSRVSWIVASEQLVERFTRHFECSVQNASGVAQIALFKLLDEEWGHAGYLDWLIHLRLSYTRRRDDMLHACEQYLPKEVTSWVAPTAGMFHWIEVAWRKHPGFAKGLSHAEIEESIFKASIDRGSLLCQGSWFRADTNIPEDKMFFRATYAAAPANKIQEAIKRFSDALRAEFAL
ncbi:putative aromatic aminotransferase Aro8 [Talaromyces proteolyticus]|uniref:aromatic-amino-acid transaminase n=1 Tax=Talaromyces proteolyticus TaxID=1131652 RepID=A0AAD4L0D5_9EURO|nr:putative aromatic aminotransferase Aro8 [Talaromyces proteolyticus]KAH8705212.1 putative aromatic aminotransferase Aro8 [Talaromyces proteolyticus]